MTFFPRVLLPTCAQRGCSHLAHWQTKCEQSSRCSYSPVLQLEAGLQSIVTETTHMSAADAPMIAHKWRIGKRNASKEDLPALGMSTCRKPKPCNASDYALTNTATKLLTNVARIHYSTHALRCYIILFLWLVYRCSYSPVLQLEAGLESILNSICMRF